MKTPKYKSTDTIHRGFRGRCQQKKHQAQLNARRLQATPRLSDSGEVKSITGHKLRRALRWDKVAWKWEMKWRRENKRVAKENA